MEVLLSEDKDQDEQYHDTERHGFFWVLLNKLLHLIVLFYSLFGMIHFEVAFIKRGELVRLISFFLIAVSWYLTMKFGLIAFLLQAFEFILLLNGLNVTYMNCSLSNFNQAYITRGRELAEKGIVELELYQVPKNLKPYWDYLSSNWISIIAPLVENYGGPYKLLGNATILVFGFYAIAVYYMLAIWPIELFFVENVAFNYIRFVLNDPSCLKDFYQKRKNYCDMLDNWFNYNLNSQYRHVAERSVHQRYLRSDILADYQHLKPDNWLNLAKFSNEVTSRGKDAASESKSNLSPSLRHTTLATNYNYENTYGARVANKNVRKFIPLVRSESGFKFSMISYPLFIFFYFTTLAIIIGFVSMVLNVNLRKLNQECIKRIDPSIDLFSNWYLWDRIIFYEALYTVFCMSMASSFYCSYYFNTVLELNVWAKEILHQLELCQVIVELPFDDEPLPLTHDLDNVSQYFTKFGSIKSLWSYVRYISSSRSTRGKICKALCATNSAHSKQTILRATALNIRLFMDEHEETRFMTTTILKRTTSIAIGFTVLVALTSYQFKENIFYLDMLIGACLAILNLYYIFAALINTSVSRACRIF